MKRIIAAALSILVGAFGYTIVDSAIEDRVATLESEVVELREEVSKNHPQYETTLKSTTKKETTTYKTEPFAIGSYLTEDPDSLHKFLIREYTNGEYGYVSYYNYEPVSFVDKISTSAKPVTTHPTTTQPTTTDVTNDDVSDGFVTTTHANLYIPKLPVADYFLYITESSAQITDITEEVSYVYGYDKDYSAASTPVTTKTTTYITVSCKGNTDPALSGKKIVLYIFDGDGNVVTHLFGLKEIIINNINSDGTFEYKAIYATTRKNFSKYSFATIDIV